MEPITAMAREHGVLVIEDAAQGLGARHRGIPLGRFGDLAATSFHETKNVMAGEGGALLVNNPLLAERAEIIREKGTDRRRFFRGEVDKYTWIDVGSSYAPSELMAAFLWAQMQEAERIRQTRLEIWHWYYDAFIAAEKRGRLTRPRIPESCEHNAHMFYVLVNDAPTRAKVLSALNADGVNAVFHYVPLHSSAAGRRFGRTSGELQHTDNIASRLIRLPMWIGMQRADVDRAAAIVARAIA
jgi:dTDP-4-amino-4,6-dideoxygalactose transaminase